MLARFPTAWEFGGRRLALCGSIDRPIVIAGAWGRPGVCGYGDRTGEPLWENCDLTRSDMIAPAGDGGSAHRHLGVTRT